MNPYSGAAYGLYPLITLMRANGRLKDGMKVGVWENYHKNGQLQETGNFSNGALDGPSERYHENGQLRQKGSYANNDKCGEWTEYGEAVSHRSCPAG